MRVKIYQATETTPKFLRVMFGQHPPKGEWFDIPTEGNLPIANTTTPETFDSNILIIEMMGYVTIHGTDEQRALIA